MLKKLFVVFVITFCLGTLLYGQPGTLPGFTKSRFFDEQLLTFKFPSDVTIHINAPKAESLRTDRITRIVLFTLPNGNTIDWTIGKEAGPNDDWHYEIQHIGAQTRFLRRLAPGQNIVTVYLEAAGLSWPIWSQNHPSDKYKLIYAIVDSVRSIFTNFPHEVVLNGHSGGGNFLFNFLNGQEAIPDFVKRIAFLDSDYNYSDDLRHGDKLAAWLNAAPDHFLCVLAYNDSIALYEGQPVVSPTGGTWYRSKMMQRKLAEYFTFSFEENPEFLKYVALNGRIQFWLKKNPTRAILHTVQVERNGFIHSVVSGTANDHIGYEYYGEHAYEDLVEKLPPEDIGALLLEKDSAGSLRLTCQPVPHGETYRFFWSRDGLTFPDSLDLVDPSLALPFLEMDSLYFFQIQGLSPWGKSRKSELLAGVAGATAPDVLIVNGFDTDKNENTRNFVRQHAGAFFANGRRLLSASNDAVTSGLINLSDFPVVDFVVGFDIYLNESVSPDEQALLKTYLRNGGQLFISGNDLSFDLDSKGKADDRDFCHNFLKLKFQTRAPLNHNSTHYQVEFWPDWVSVPTLFSFDDGTHGTYDVSRPDAIKPKNGSQACLFFSEVDTSAGVAGVAFSGLFPAGNRPGKVVATTVPLETIYLDSARTRFLGVVLDFFDPASTVAFPVGGVPEFFLASYPNPFNPETRIVFSLPEKGLVRLTIFNALGQQIAEPASGLFAAGLHEVAWHAGEQSSGIYFYRLEAPDRCEIRKMALVR